MIFKITRTSDESCKWREISTIEQLMEFAEENEHDLVVGFDPLDNEPFIEIYDDYRE